MPNSVSSVRGLARAVALDVDGDRRETPEQMMHRVDRDEVAAVCRHLVGSLDDRRPDRTPDPTPDRTPDSPHRAGRR